MKKIRLLFLILIAFSFLSLKSGEKAPSFVLRDIYSKMLIFSERCGNPSTSKEVIIIDFFATWCEPCKRAVGSLKKILEEFKGNVDIFLISFKESAKSLRGFFGDELPPFTILPDPYGEIATKYEVNALPRTFIISGKDCLIREIFYGEKENYYEELKKNIKKILGVSEGKR